MTHRAESTKATGSTETTETSDERTHPLLRVVKGSPTDDELAALTAVVGA
ncbi:acyl-CoA carboxylase subunit epsilon, partial [Saccharomonospora azurea]